MTSLLKNKDDIEYHILDFDIDNSINDKKKGSDNITDSRLRLLAWLSTLFIFIGYTRLLCFIYMFGIFDKCKDYTEIIFYNSFSEIFTRGTILFFISRVNNIQVYKKWYYYFTISTTIIIWELLDKVFPDLYIRSSHIPTKYTVLLAFVSLLVLALFIHHIRLAYKLNKKYVYIYIATIIGIVIYYSVFYYLLEKYYNIYIHHYFIFGSIALIPQFDNKISMIFFSICTGVWLHGIGVYGAGDVI